MRPLSKVLLVALVVALFAGWSRLSHPPAGFAVKGVSGYHVSTLEYELSGDQVVAVHFTVSPRQARTAEVAANGGRPVTCMIEDGRARCPLHVSAAALTTISVVVSG